MRLIVTASLLFATAAGPALAQPSSSPDRRLAALVRQDAVLRQRIGQIQLDALVSRVDATLVRKERAVSRLADGAALQRLLDL